MSDHVCRNCGNTGRSWLTGERCPCGRVPIAYGEMAYGEMAAQHAQSPQAQPDMQLVPLTPSAYSPRLSPQMSSAPLTDDHEEQLQAALVQRVDRATEELLDALKALRAVVVTKPNFGPQDGREGRFDRLQWRWVWSRAWPTARWRIEREIGRS